MVRSLLGFAARRPTALCIPFLLFACGGSEELGPEASLAVLVGTWDADRFVVRNKANPAQSPELIRDLGAQFWFNIEPSGQYVATLVYQNTPIVELGRISVDGSEIVFAVSYPAMATNRSRYSVVGTRLTLDGETQFDFNFDTVGDPAEAHIELKKR